GGHGACACAPMKIAPSTKLWGVTDLAEQLTLALAQHHRAQLLQAASKRFNCEFITQTRRGSELLQPIRIRDVLANRGCKAHGSRFLKDDSVKAVLHNFAAKFRGHNG